MTRTPKVSINETTAYAMGWIVTDTLNGRVIWHNGGTDGFGAEIGFLPGRGVGTIVLTNQGNIGFPDSVGLWVYDRLLGNPETDYAKQSLARAKAAAEKEAARYRKPAAPRPPPASTGLVGDYQSDVLGLASLVADKGGALFLTVQKTGARLRLVPFDGAVFMVYLVPQAPFADIVASQGDAPMGFADFEPDAEGHLSRLRWQVAGQTFRWRSNRSKAPENSNP